MPRTVRDCPFPECSVLDPALVARAWYRDAYSVALRDGTAAPATIFNAVFGHRPPWMRWVMALRNGLAARAGLTVSSPDAMQASAFPAVPAVGGTIGGWPVHALTERELVAGRDNAHLDFRVSVMRVDDAAGARAVVATVCDVHNRFGKAYLALILPLHRRGLRWLIASAVSAGRL